MRSDDLDVIDPDDDGLGSLRERAQVAAAALRAATDVPAPRLRRTTTPVRGAQVWAAVTLAALAVIGGLVLANRGNRPTVITAPPLPTTPPARTARAAQFVADLATARFNPVVDGVEAQLNTQDPATAEWKAWTKAFGRYRSQGPPVEVACNADFENCLTPTGTAGHMVGVPVVLARGQIHIQILFDQTGAIVKYTFLAPDASPAAVAGRPVISNTVGVVSATGPLGDKATVFINDVIAGRYEAARAMFSPLVATLVTQAALRRSWEEKTGQLGEVQPLGPLFFLGATTASAGYRLDVTFKRGTKLVDVQVNVGVDEKQRIAGFGFTVGN